MRPQRFGRAASLMQIAAAVVGSAAATQVIPSKPTDGACCEFHDVDGVEDVQCCNACPFADGPDIESQAEQHTYLTGGTPGVSETPHRLDVIGANQRRLIAFRAPEGVWIGGCLVSSPEDVVRLSEWLSGGGNGHA